MLSHPIHAQIFCELIRKLLSLYRTILARANHNLNYNLLINLSLQKTLVAVKLE